MVESNRKEDHILEKPMKRFFDIIYSFLGITYQRNNNISEDMAGCDTKFFKSGKSFVIDEKCATDYYYKDLKTFAMELSAVSQKEDNNYARYKGWFVDPNKNTEYYALSYVRATSKKDIKKGVIHSFEVIIVNRKKIEEYILNTANTTLAGIEKVTDIEDLFVKRIKSGNFYTQKNTYDFPKENCVVKRISNGNYDWKFAPNLKIVWTAEGKVESPICICVNKEILSQLSCYHAKLSVGYNGEMRITKIK